MIIVHVARKPIEGTLNSTAVEWGTGGLALDKCRLSAKGDYSDRPFHASYKATSMPYMGSLQTRPWVARAIAEGRPVSSGQPHAGGRWPPNVILEHTPGCRILGTVEQAYAINAFSDGMKPFGGGAGHSFGTTVRTEVVDKWECQDNCPVGVLDAFTDLKMSKGGGGPKSPVWTPSVPSKMKKDYGDSVGYDDIGHASRYFKQVQDK